MSSLLYIWVYMYIYHLKADKIMNSRIIYQYWNVRIRGSNSRHITCWNRQKLTQFKFVRVKIILYLKYIYDKKQLFLIILVI